MNRYALKFYKTGNMRFISHLDLQRMFRRCLRRADIRPAFTQGFNPHERLNLVQPLTLGFEGKNEIFEIISEYGYSPEELIERLNSTLPEGIRFFDCKTLTMSSKNLSSVVKSAEYEIIFKYQNPDNHQIDIEKFLNKEEITILKKDKKTKQLKEKNVKDMVYSFRIEEYGEGSLKLNARLACAGNNSLNPSSLCEAFASFCGIEFLKDESHFTRLGFYYDKEGRDEDLWNIED